MALHRDQRPHQTSLWALLSYLAGTRDSQRRQQPISSVVSIRANHALDHGHHADALEQVQLFRILFKHLREGKPLDGPSPVIYCRRLDGDVCWLARLGLFDGEEASTRIRWT